jgi:hypothetical protein
VGIANPDDHLLIIDVGPTTGWPHPFFETGDQLKTYTEQDISSRLAVASGIAEHRGVNRETAEELLTWLTEAKWHLVKYLTQLRREAS